MKSFIKAPLIFFIKKVKFIRFLFVKLPLNDFKFISFKFIVFSSSFKVHELNFIFAFKEFVSKFLHKILPDFNKKIVNFLDLEFLSF